MVGLTACETDKSGIGVTLSPGGEVEILVKTCRENATVKEIRLEDYRDGDDKAVVWRIVSREGSALRAFTLGESPAGFETIQPLDEPSLLSTRVVAVVVTSEVKHQGVTFDPGKLRQGVVAMAASHELTTAEFAERSVCN